MSGNLIDDDLLRMLMTGLVKNNTITCLDMSHNKITNHGARLVSKLLGENSVLTALNLSDNQIHVEGGRFGDIIVRILPIFFKLTRFDLIDTWPVDLEITMLYFNSISA